MRRLATILVAAAAASVGGCVAGGGGCGDGGGYRTPPPRDTQPAGGYVYKCPMDGAVIDAPGACPKCGMTLDERHRTARDSSGTTPQVQYTCPMHPEVVASKPGDCPKCGMALVEKR
ncbi:MAG: hypothetical protein HYY17_07365 [Planctomycetes bacterium]|nr:hypothetical protein [Planctomycetota bacterium]